jgi:hypothetical protein
MDNQQDTNVTIFPSGKDFLSLSFGKKFGHLLPPKEANDSNTKHEGWWAAWAG